MHHDWAVSTDVDHMLSIGRAQGWLRDRKLRLFACFCARQAWPLLSDERSRAAVEVGEAFADGQASENQLDAAWNAGCAARPTLRSGWRDAACMAAMGAARTAARYTAAIAAEHTSRDIAWALTTQSTPAEVPEWGRKWDQIRKTQADILRWMVPPAGLVFLPQWRTVLVLQIARDIYQRGLCEEQGVLADALEDAGCSEGGVLSFLREGNPFFKGQWALDLVLGLNP